ncbi:hypothetical protein BC332_20975 [Capsicum chinense]|nr:hypothetical protein BC332_20975 [Capsicum chinense]
MSSCYKRILVVGRPLRKDVGAPSQGSDQIITSNLFDKGPPLNRFKVPIEVERLTDNDLVLEQFLPPVSPMLADVCGVLLLVSPYGYSMEDAPVVQIWASSKIHKEERSCVGKWDMRSLITSSSELCGLEKSSEVPRHVKYSFRNPVRCRMIWITLRLQKVGSSSVDFEKD